MNPLLRHDQVINCCSQANIFINADRRAQLADFGLSIVGETTVGRMSSASNNGGNIRYLAPERVDPASQDMRRTIAGDVYGLACVCLYVSSTLRSWVIYIAYRTLSCTLGSTRSVNIQRQLRSSSKS
jgi:hypothetical protein